MSTAKSDLVASPPPVTDYQFTETQDWFSFNIAAWKNLFPLVSSSTPRVLEIGSWEGRSAVFMLTELCTGGGEVVCIDHFDLLRTPAGRERLARMTHNLSSTGKPYRIIDQFSVPGLMSLLSEEIANDNPGFDWIYVDGSHEADDTFLDGELAWRLARQGAIFIFDDYHWDAQPVDSIHHPKRGIDAFLALHANEYDMLSSPDQYQVVLRKRSAMRIGFLVKDQVQHDIAAAAGYGINVALAVDSSYAMAAAVCMLSVIERTPGRLSFYVIDCGLSLDDRDGILNSVPKHEQVTIQFIPLHGDALSHIHGAVWAKVDMFAILPVERVLYLDSDVLVRVDIRQLWDVDLQGHPLAAVIDVGHPLGHDATNKRPYFNAGVLLIDLARAREDKEMLRGLAAKYDASEYRDQDALNAHFAGKWLPLDLSWNAQGLGTYANYPSVERAVLDMQKLEDPRIVHFTGPVHPSIAQLLSPYVQPCTAKPWGYAGAPGHPFAHEWWEMLEKTEWKGMRETGEYAENMQAAKKTAWQQAEEALDVKLDVAKLAR